MPRMSGASSSGSPSPPSTPRPEEEAGVHYSLDGLASAWDQEASIRERFRSSQQLCRHFDPKEGKELDQFVERSTHNLKTNVAVISPLAKIMRENQCAIPSIDSIIHQVDLLYKIAKHPMPRGDRICQEGWAVRRLVALLKQLTYKRAPPKEGVQNPIVIYLQSVKNKAHI